MPWPTTETRLGRLPENERTPEACLRAVEWCGRELFWVPPALRTPAIYEAAVANCGRALFWVPPEEQTRGMVLAAVADCSDALAWVREDLKPAVRRAADAPPTAAELPIELSEIQFENTDAVR